MGRSKIQCQDEPRQHYLTIPTRAFSWCSFEAVACSKMYLVYSHVTAKYYEVLKSRELMRIVHWWQYKFCGFVKNTKFSVCSTHLTLVKLDIPIRELLRQLTLPLSRALQRFDPVILRLGSAWLGGFGQVTFKSFQSTSEALPLCDTSAII